LANVISLGSVAIVSNSPSDRFINFDNSARLTVAPGVNASGASSLINFNGFTNEGIGSVTIGAGAKVNVANFQSYGLMNLTPASSGGLTLLTNLGAAPLFFNGGSRTFVGTPATATASPPVTGVDLHGQNLVIAGGLFVNNGFVADSVSGGNIIVDFGALY
jgi:hypothetical protein